MLSLTALAIYTIGLFTVVPWSNLINISKIKYFKILYSVLIMVGEEIIGDSEIFTIANLSVSRCPTDIQSNGSEKVFKCVCIFLVLKKFSCWGKHRCMGKWLARFASRN